MGFPFPLLLADGPLTELPDARRPGRGVAEHRVGGGQHEGDEHGLDAGGREALLQDHGRRDRHRRDHGRRV